MGKYILKRTGIALIQLFVVATIVFLFLRIMPGDPVKLALGTEKALDEEVVAAMRSQLGLDQPLPTQYFEYLKGLLTLDFGTSITDRSSVFENIAQRLPRTIELAVVAIIIAAIFGTLMGILAALNKKNPVDYILTTLSTLGITLPVFVIGTILILIFSLQLKWLPSSGYVAFSRSPIQHIERLLLPAVALALGLASSTTRMTRSSMLDVQSKDFIRTLKAKGLSNTVVVFKHGFRNALIPVITVLGLQLGNLIGGSVLVEQLFNWPGISSLLIKGISYRDYPTIQGCIFVISVFFIFVNLLVDIIYSLLDPRVR